MLKREQSLYRHGQASCFGATGKKKVAKKNKMMLQQKDIGVIVTKFFKKCFQEVKILQQKNQSRLILLW